MVNLNTFNIGDNNVYQSKVKLHGLKAVASSRVSAKPAEAHPPTLNVSSKNTAIRRIDDTASADTLFAFIHGFTPVTFCEGG